MTLSNVQYAARNAMAPDGAHAAREGSLDRLRALAAGRAYEPPRIVSFPVVAPTVADAMTFTGNF